MSMDLRVRQLIALETTYAYEYRFEHKATYCVRIRLVRSKRLMRTGTTLRVKRLIAYL